MPDAPIQLDPQDFSARLGEFLGNHPLGDDVAVAVLFLGETQAPPARPVPFKGLHLAFQVQISAPNLRAASVAAQTLIDSFCTVEREAGEQKVKLQLRSFDRYLTMPSSRPASPRMLPHRDGGPKAAYAFNVDLWACNLPRN